MDFNKPIQTGPWWAHLARPLSPWSSPPLSPRSPWTWRRGAWWSGCWSRPSSGRPRPSPWSSPRSLGSPSCPDGEPGGSRSPSRSRWCTRACCLCRGPWASPWSSGTGRREPPGPGRTGTWLQEHRGLFVTGLYKPGWGSTLCNRMIKSWFQHSELHWQRVGGLSSPGSNKA